MSNETNTRKSGDPRRARGQAGEAAAERLLIAAGYTIVECNWRCPLGEIDLVTQHRGEWVFVEVRFRDEGVDAALESVGPQKRRRLQQLAEAYLVDHGLTDVPARVDLIAVGMGGRGKSADGADFDIEIIENAVGW
jgi:putative endonuclease